MIGFPGSLLYECSIYFIYSLRVTGDSYDSPEEGFYPVAKRPRTDAFAPLNPMSNSK